MLLDMQIELFSTCILKPKGAKDIRRKSSGKRKKPGAHKGLRAQQRKLFIVSNAEDCGGQSELKINL